MKRAHYLAIRVLSKPADIGMNSDALKALLSSGNTDVEIPLSGTTGEETTQPVLLTSFLKKESDINHLFKFLAANIASQDKEIILKEADKYVDDHLDFFLRFEREPWVLEKKLILTTKGDCFHLTFSMAAYPKTKDRAIELVRKVFSSPKVER